MLSRLILKIRNSDRFTKPTGSIHGIIAIDMFVGVKHS